MTNKIAQQILDFYDNDPTKWTQYTLARSDDYSLPITGSQATRFCPMGVVFYKLICTVQENEVFRSSFYKIHNQSVPEFNDTHTFQEVLEALKNVN